MKIATQISDLHLQISDLKNERPEATVGFVPTMGALHQGHLSLIRLASDRSDIVVCSIFVNPTQFNDPKDLKKYPRQIERDIELLSETNCDILFLPKEEEIYPKGHHSFEMDFNGLDEVMEGKFRPGHFKGVAMVVNRFFEIVEPDLAFFGLKDFQQVAIIQQMVKTKELNVEIIPAPIVRSDKGLALSSRNQLLSESEKEEALIIYQTLKYGKTRFDKTPLKELQADMIRFFEQGHLKLEYLEIVDHETLKFPKDKTNQITCCIAAYCGKVRLIDNMQLNS